MTKLLQRRLAGTFPVAVAGDGVAVITADGRRYLDACGGAAVSCLGHNHPAVVEAIRRHCDRLDYVHSSFFSTEPAEELAADLVDHAPPGLVLASLVSGGSEAVETALKLARQTAVERGEPGRRVVISRDQSFHGNTLGALSISGNLGRRRVYDALLFRAEFIPPCFSYRRRRADESEEAYGLRAANELETRILEVGPENVLAFVAETVVGATTGAVTAAPGYFRRVREICDRYGVLLILDEVMSGMGRTGTLHACEQEGVSPDLLTLAKGLGGGYAPIGAVLVGTVVRDAIAGGSGLYQHGFTYMGHPLSASVGLAVQKVIREEDLLANVRRRGDELMAALRQRLGDHPHVGDIRGRGLLLAIELVTERAGKTPFEPALKIYEAVRRAALDVGLMVYAMPGTVDGVCGDHVLLAPPYTITADHVAEIANGLAAAVKTATGV